MFVALFFFWLIGGQVSAKDQILAYFSNDSLNGLKLSDAYETHNMGLIYLNDEYYFKLDLGIVTPDMYVYRNEYREANRSFGELISVEIGSPYNLNQNFRFYGRARLTGRFGIDKLQDFAHRLLFLQQVNKVNDLIRMPADAWVGIGLRSDFKLSPPSLKNIKLNLDGFVGSDTTYLDAILKREFYRSALTYDLSVAGRLVAYDRIVSAPPINAKERGIIPTVSVGATLDAGPYKFFIRDTFSIPSIQSDSSFYGVLSVGASYSF